MKKLTINTEFNIGDLVYSVLGGDFGKGVIVGMLLRAGGTIEYNVSWKTGESGWYIDIELSTSDMSILDNL